MCRGKKKLIATNNVLWKHHYANIACKYLTVSNLTFIPGALMAFFFSAFWAQPSSVSLQLYWCSDAHVTTAVYVYLQV